MSIENNFADSIVAIATPCGSGGISIVRLSGSNSLNIAKKLTKKDNLQARFAHLCFLKDSQNEVIDEAIVIYFKNPHSFTGEDVVEFQTHGGNMVASMIVEECINNGARLANPGEFSKRAFLNDKMDLTKAEAITALIDAKSKEAVKLLSKQLKGELKDFVEEIRDELVEILAFIEVNIDYAEEDLPKDLENQILQKLNNIQEKLSQTLISSSLREGMIDGYKISIIGKPNVGKSTILNKLLSFDRAIISDIAGTTRDTIEESLRIGAHLVKIVDTAGIRESSEEIEKIGIQRSIKSSYESDIILAVFDLSRPLDDEDGKIISLLKELQDKDIIIIYNKKDKDSGDFDKKKLKDFKSLLFSKEQSIEEIVKSIKAILDKNNFDDGLVLISKRQVDAVKVANKAIKESISNLEIEELELFAYNINDAITAISSITKSFDRDEILDKMFGSFCLGK